MTWFGWILLLDLAISAALHVANNHKRAPRTPHELAVQTVVYIAYFAGILAIGTGSL